MVPNSNLERLSRYLENVSALSKEYSASVFWENRLGDFKTVIKKQNIQTISMDNIEDIVKSLGYHSDHKTSEEILSSIDKTLQLLDKTLKKTNSETAGIEKTDWEHLNALYFLKRYKLLELYTAFLKDMQIASNMSIARHFYYAYLLGNLMRKYLNSAASNVLEIGAGAAILAVFLTRKGLVKNYCIVDLPEMLINSSNTILSYVPDAQIYFNEPVQTDTLSEATRFWLFSPQNISMIPDGFFQLALNFNSFMEMDKAARDSYIELIYRTGSASALFVNSNRRQAALPQRDGSSFDNHPLFYPYHSDDLVAMWEPDEFQQATRSNFGTTPLSFSILRVAVINR